MYIVLTSYVFGAIVIFVIPMMAALMWSSTYQGTRVQRLAAWQLVTLLATTMLALYTYFYVRPTGEVVTLLAETPLWVSCGAGIVLSFVLGALRWHLSNKLHLLEQRLARAILQR